MIDFDKIEELVNSVEPQNKADEAPEHLNPDMQEKWKELNNPAFIQELSNSYFKMLLLRASNGGDWKAAKLNPEKTLKLLHDDFADFIKRELVSKLND